MEPNISEVKSPDKSVRAAAKQTATGRLSAAELIAAFRRNQASVADYRVNGNELVCYVGGSEVARRPFVFKPGPDVSTQETLRSLIEKSKPLFVDTLTAYGNFSDGDVFGSRSEGGLLKITSRDGRKYTVNLETQTVS